jgi:hypothetical protein
MAGLKPQKEPRLRLTALFPIVGLILAASAWAAASKSAPPVSGPAPVPPPKSDSAKAGTGTTAPVAARPDSGSADSGSGPAKKRPATSHPSASADTAAPSGKSDSAEAADAIRATTDSIALAAGMTPVQDSSQYIKLYEYIANPMLQLATFPVELVLVPAVKAVIFPSKAPLRYMVNENVIDRTIKLISYGENDAVMIYPTLNLAPGTGSYTGLTMRHQAIFGRPTERLVAYGYLYVNGDWKFRTYLAAKEILGTGFTSKVSVGLTRVKNSSVYQPETASKWFFSDSTNTFSANLGHLVFEKFALKGSYSFRDNNYGKAPPQEDSLHSDFFRNESGELDAKMRGLDKSWQDHSLAMGLGRDTRNNENIPLNGSNFNAVYHYHFTNAEHDYHGWEATLSNYFKLGKEKYEVYVPPGKKSSATGVRKVLERMDLDNLKNELFNRKALVTHLYAAQSFELPGNHMPVYGLQTLGNDTPLRGYGGSRFRDYTVFSAGAEYRFPLMRLVDGMMFNEYGVYGRSWDKIDVLDNIKNSWGFGIRVRRPDIYLFRLQLGFHGAQGIEVNMSVDEPY